MIPGLVTQARLVGRMLVETAISRNVPTFDIEIDATKICHEWISVIDQTSRVKGTKLPEPLEPLARMHARTHDET